MNDVLEPENLHSTSTKKRWADLAPRVIYGTLFASFALFFLLFHALTFYALVLVIALLMYAEWLDLTKNYPLLNRVGGLVYVGLPVWSLLALYDAGGAMLILPLCLMVVATDIMAYFGGKLWGRHKIVPSISPGKSWQGLGCGMLAAAAVAVVASLTTPYPVSIVQALWIGLLIAAVAQCGDFFESFLKRQAGVKDSGTLLPGHGGILDRVDGLVFAAPVYALLALL